MPQHPFTEEVTAARARVRLERPVRGVVVTRVDGFASVDVGRRIIGFVDSAIADGEIPTVFHDWELASGYEPALRPIFTDWYRMVKAKTAGVHVLTKSKLVSMGVSLVAMATGSDIAAYRDRASFEKALGEAVVKAKVSSRRAGD
jgi:hypothetical protein